MTNRKMTDDEALAAMESGEGFERVDLSEVASISFEAGEGFVEVDVSLADAVASAAADLDRAQSVVDDAVVAARAGGVPWSAIAMALGVTRQAATKRYRSSVEAAQTGA